MRLFVKEVFAIGSLLAVMAGCAGGDDGSGGTIDAAATGDSGSQTDGGTTSDSGNAPDAIATDGGVSPGEEGIGKTCVSSNAMSCPEGFDCLALASGTNPWCSKTCDNFGEDDPACGTGYEGPGMAGCYYRITAEGGAESDYCGVICEAPDGQCAASVCDGTCPGDLECIPNEGTPGVSFCG